MTKERIKVISLIGLLVFSLLLSGRLIYNNQWVNANLVHESQKIPGVVSVKTVDSSGQQELDVVTNNVQDLVQTSQALEKVAGKLPIRLLDTRDAALEKVYNQMQFPLQEAIARGNFTEMEQKIEQLGSSAGVQVNLTMDAEAIYLIMNQGATHQLVSVLDRHDDGSFLPSMAASQ